MLSRNLIDIGLHQHLSKLEVFLHLFKLSLHRDISILVRVLDLVDLALLDINEILYLLILMLLILYPPFNVVDLFKQSFLVKDLLPIEAHQLVVHGL